MVGLMPPVEGLLHSAEQFDQAVNRVARASLGGTGSQDTVDLSAAAVALLQSRNSFDANTKVVKTADEMDQTLVNMVA